MNIVFTRNARALFEDERRRRGSSDLGIQIGFVYGCGGAGFRVVFRADPQGSHVVDVEGVRIALDAESRERLDGMIIDSEERPEPGFVLRHPDAALVEFC
jgi:Fe-S cluster assembly iron-binding protein IscA